MPEWWTYSLADFLMFAPRTYWRLVTLYNADVWPTHVVAWAGGLGALVLAARWHAATQRVVAALLALAWGWVAWGWLHLRFATINWPADYAAAAFGVQAALLIAIAVTRHGFGPPARNAPAGLALTAFAVIAYPFLAPLAGRGLAAAEVFGLMPDPTAIATLGLLASAPRALRRVLLPIPLAWCAAGGAMLWTMGEPGWWLPPAAALLALLAPRAQRSAANSRRNDSRSS